MQRLVVVSIVASVVYLALPPNAKSQNATVGLVDAIQLEPAVGTRDDQGRVFGPTGMTFGQAALWNNYFLTQQIADGPTLYPEITVGKLAQWLADGYGLWLFSGHGGIDSLDIEYYPDTHDGRMKCNAVFEQYKRDGIPAAQIYQRSESGRYVVIGIRSPFIQERFYSWHSLVHLNACRSESWQSDFATAQTFLGYERDEENWLYARDTQEIYLRMMGKYGVQGRRLDNAAQGRTVRWTGAGNVVLAPIVKDSNVHGLSPLREAQQAWVTFDCQMDTIVLAGRVVMSTPPIAVENVRWSSADKIEFQVRGCAEGSGTAYVQADKFDFVHLKPIEGARSDQGLIGLDGNVDPDTNGVVPNWDNYVWAVESRMADCPAAQLGFFMALREPSGVRVRWSTLKEDRTERFMVERATSWRGPFSQVGEVAANSSPHYEVFDSSVVDTIYRLRERETTGCEHIVFADAVKNALPRPGVESLPVDTDSLLQAQLEQYPGNPHSAQEPPPRYEYMIIVPEAWWSAAQAFANSKVSTPPGFYAGVVTLEELGGAGGIRAFLASEHQYGELKYVLLGGDWDFRPDSLVARVLEPPYVPDPELDSWGMRAFPSDWLLVDFNGDSLPDLPIGRFPARSAGEFTLMAQKAQNAAGQGWTGGYLDHIGMWCYARTNGRANGPCVEMLADSLWNEIPSRMTVRSLLDNEQDPHSGPEREQLAVAALNEGRSMVITLGTDAAVSHWARWLDWANEAFTWTDAGPTTVLPFLLGLSCEIGKFDDFALVVDSLGQRTSRGLLELGLMQLDRGPWGGFCATRGTLQEGNYILAKEFLNMVYNYGSGSGGEAARLAIWNVACLYPRYMHQALSTMYFGDPSLTLPNQPVTTVDAGEPNQQWKDGLRVGGGSPARGEIRLEYTTAKAGMTELSIYDIAGRRVARVQRGYTAPGRYQAQWEGRKGSGVYFVRLVRDGQTVATRKVVLLN